MGATPASAPDGGIGHAGQYITRLRSPSPQDELDEHKEETKIPVPFKLQVAGKSWITDSLCLIQSQIVASWTARWGDSRKASSRTDDVVGSAC